MRNKEMNKSCNLTLFFGRNNLVTHLNNSGGSNTKFNEILRFSEELPGPLKYFTIEFLELRTRFSEQKCSDGPRLLNREKPN